VSYQDSDKRDDAFMFSIKYPGVIQHESENLYANDEWGDTQVSLNVPVSPMTSTI
jgi:hypothetical protein